MSELPARGDGKQPPADERPARRGWSRSPRHHWANFTNSPYLPAVVLSFIVAAAAGLFAGSYSYAMANPNPHRVPIAVVAGTQEVGNGKGHEFLEGLERALHAALVVHPFATEEQALDAVEQQRVFAVLHGDGPDLRFSTVGAAGASVARVLSTVAPQVARQVGVSLTIDDIKPLQKGDPRGLAIFYMTLAALVPGFVGSIQLGVHAERLPPVARIAFTAFYALLGGCSIVAVVDGWVGALRLPFPESWLILSLTMFASGMVFAMFQALAGRWALLPTWLLLVMLGNPSSGGAVSWPLLPSVLGAIGRWLPPGASVNAQHAAIYFPGHQDVESFVVLGMWALTAMTIYWIRRPRAVAAENLPG